MASSVLVAAPLSAASEHCTFAVQAIRSLRLDRGPFGDHFEWFEVLIRPLGIYRDFSPSEFVDRLYCDRDTFHTDSEVLRRASDWVMTREHPHRISVNTHPQSLTHRSFIAQALETHERLAELGHSLCLELIEYGRCSKKGDLITNAKKLRSAGVLIALDDFGSRINCFDLCAAGIVDLLKIDLRLINGLERDANQQAVVRSIVTLGQGLNAKVVAEGVETAAQADFLQEMGVDFAQGFFFHKPQRLEL